MANLDFYGYDEIMGGVPEYGTSSDALSNIVHL